MLRLQAMADRNSATKLWKVWSVAPERDRDVMMLLVTRSTADTTQSLPGIWFYAGGRGCTRKGVSILMSQ